MNRKVEQKLKRSLSITLPKLKEDAKKRRYPKLQYGYAFGTLILAFCFYVFLTPTLYFNESDKLPIQEVRTMLLLEGDTSSFPWQESNLDTYQYQIDEEVLKIIVTSEEEIYQIILEKAKLLVEPADKSSKVEGQLLYFYKSESSYFAKWQHEDYIITVETIHGKTNLVNKIKQIMKENLK